MKFSDAVQGFTYYLSSNGRSTNTIKLYTTYLLMMDSFLEHPDLEQISSSDVTRYYAYMRHDYMPQRVSGDTSPLSDGTIQNIWIAIRAFYNWAEKELHILRADGSILKPEFEYPEVSPFSLEEIRKLLKACEFQRPATPSNRGAYIAKRPSRLRDQALIMLLLDTGLRVSEACRLKISDVNFDTSEIYLAPFGSGRKTKSRHIPIGNSCKKYLWTYLKSRENASVHDPVFITRAGSAMTKDSVKGILYEISDLAGVRNCHPHRFRHTFAIEFLRNGGDVFSLQRILGHSTLTMVNTYLQLAQSDVAAAHRRASPADRVKL